MSELRPMSLVLAALGGQGGGVVSGWLTAVARAERHLVQATSVPGVAQRTGATIYYFEFFPEAALPADGRLPVMALMPNPGDVDVVVAAELVEAGRVLQRGLVTPDRTTLITSTHRAYTISEKSHPADGRVDGDLILAAAAAQARRFVSYDMAEIAERERAVISAALLGAIAGGAGLPFALDAYRAAIRAAGVAVERNLAAFEASAARAAELAPAAERAPDGLGRLASSVRSDTSIAASRPALPAAVAARIARDFPSAAHAIVELGAARLLDYQDASYARQYLDALQPFAALDRARGADDARLTVATARSLALWMSFEDTIRVAELKARSARLQHLQRSAASHENELVRVTEYLKPRVEEICGTLPAGLGRRCLESGRARRVLARLTGGRQVRSSTISGFLLLRTVASLRRWRRGTLRFAEEQQRIAKWLELLSVLAAADYDLAVEVAESQKLVRGYGDTHARGLQNFEHLCAESERLVRERHASPAVEFVRLRSAVIAAVAQEACA